MPNTTAGRGPHEREREDTLMLRPAEFTAYTLGLDGSEITADETEFLLAILAYQKRFRRRYPTWREVLHIARCLGYRKVAEPERLGEPQPPLPPGEQTHDIPGEPPCQYLRAS
jgi:hypothetical protein